NLVALHFKYDQARRRFVEWAQNEIAVVPDFHKRILFSDEAHFWLNGYVIKQNCRIWSEANPQVYVETPLHPEKLTVWCALWAGGIIGPYFFKNDEGHNVTVNGDRYRALITNFFIPELNNHDVQELWFQQDGATCHTARATIDLLKDTFGDRLFSRFGPVNRAPRSCDLTPLDYFLCGYVKSLVYAGKSQTLDHLEDNIRRVIANIRPQMLEKVIENWRSRLEYTRASRGSPMPEIIFKIQIEAHEIHGRKVDCTSAPVSLSFEHHAGDSTIWLFSITILRRTPWRWSETSLLFSSANLTKKLAAHAAKALYIYKHSCLLRDSNPEPTAQQSASLTTISDGRHDLTCISPTIRRVFNGIRAKSHDMPVSSSGPKLQGFSVTLLLNMFDEK
ncbi:uncharacterized protein TNCV_1723441, partial [Trichonephila clavipes]